MAKEYHPLVSDWSKYKSGLFQLTTVPVFTFHHIVLLFYTDKYFSASVLSYILSSTFHLVVFMYWLIPELCAYVYQIT
jgi:hypothetical protein